MANGDIGVKGWRNYSSFSLFGSGSQRADRNTSILVDTLSGNLSVIANDWNLAGRIPCALTRAYNHLDTTGGVDRPFGPGWSWQYDMCLTGNMAGAGNVTWKAADGSEYDFTYSAGPVWASPAGMHEYVLTFDSTPTPDRYFITVGTLKYTFEVNTTDSIARLIRIEDAFGNALNIVRVYSSSKPTYEIDKLQLEYDNGGVTTHDIVDFTYSGTRITQLRLLDTHDGSNYIDLHYGYSNIDSDDRLTTVTPKRGSTDLNLGLKYNYNSSAGLQLTELYDTAGLPASGNYYWQPNYTSNKVSSIVFPIDSAPTTGTVAYAYATSAPASWSHASPSSWNKVTDAEGNDWFFGQNADGTVKFAVDPLWVNSTHESYTEYAYESYFSPATYQIESVKTPKPNGESGQLTTSYYYNSDRHLAVVVDPYGFCSWYVYGTRANYAASGTGATKKEVIGIFSPLPGTQAYDEGDHTDSATAPPSLSTPVTVTSHVTYGSFIGVDYWYYPDGNAASIKLVRTVNDYTFVTGTGKLTQLLSCSPENFDESTFNSYTLTSASACSKQEYNSTTGDLYRTWTPRQFKDSSLKYSQFAYDTVFGSLTRSANADGVNSNPTTPDATEYTYDATGTLVTKVAQPEDPSNQWVEYGYSDQWYRSTVKKPDIGGGGGWGVDPIVSVTNYDYNGNVNASYQADPAATPSDWDGNTGGGGYELTSSATYDRLNRLVSQAVEDGVQATMTSTFLYDKNGNLLRQRGPAYDVGGTAHYSYNFMEYDDANRTVKAYNMVASTNASLGSVPGGTKFVQTSYDVAGNTLSVKDQLYTSGSYHQKTFSYDWGNRQILTTDYYNNGGTPTARSMGQQFDASGLLFFSSNALGYEQWPTYDLNGRQLGLRRGSTSGDSDWRVYDYNGNLEYYYTYKDNVTDGGDYRWLYTYDRLDRRVNDARQQQLAPNVWVTSGFNTAATEFDLNGNLLKSYDKVNSGKYTERVYDDWQQLTLVKAPEVPNPAGGGNIVYETEKFYDVLGRRTGVDDHMDNATLFEYDRLGRVLKVTDALLYETDTSYDARGNRYQQSMSYGAVYTYTYDDQNRLASLEVAHDSNADTTSYQYNELGQQTQVTYPDGGRTQTFYDELNRRNLTEVLLSGSDELDTTFTYDLNDRVLVTTLPGGYTIENTWDDLGNLTNVEDTNGDDTTYTYDLDNRRATETRPNGLVTTWGYDWQTGQVAAVLQEIDTTSGNDITVSYTYNANGQPTVITDGNGNTWTKTYDAMLRMTSLMMPNTNTHTITYDGNGNMIKTVDFKAQTHYYFYDALNRMIEQGPNATITTNTDKYEWDCCTRMHRYKDAFSTGSANMIAYDQLNRVTSFTDTLGNQVQYEYDPMGRVTKITPAQGSNYRTEYTYNKNGSLDTVEIYVAGTPETTTYTYNTTSGKLLQRNLPTVSAANLRTTYAYDSAGRLEYETITKETGGGSTDIYKTQYAYAYIAAGSGGGRSLTRTEQTYSGGWVNDNKVLYEWNALEWMRKEQRHDWVSSAWSAVYDVNQEYDKRGNRTRYDKNVQGSTADYGRQYDLSYSFNGSSLLTGITDASDANYSCTVTCDANNNITALDELMLQPGLPPQVNHLYTYFDVDALNRVTAHRTKAYVAGGTNAWMWAKRAHEYDGLGRLVRSTYKTWQDGSSEPAGTSLEHTYDQQGRHLQNYDGTSSYGEVWHWAGADLMPETAHPLKSPNADTASTTAYNHADNSTPQRRTFVDPTPTEGDERHLWGQGRPMAKDSSGSGSNWSTGTISQPTGLGVPAVESRLMYEGTVTTGLGRATDAREKGRIGIFGTGLSYAGSYGRVTSEAIGRDINPLGRGDGSAYVAGWMSTGSTSPSLPFQYAMFGVGNSVNNGCCGGPEGTMTQAGPTNPGTGTAAACDCGGRCEGGKEREARFPQSYKANPCCGKRKPNGQCDCIGNYDIRPHVNERERMHQQGYDWYWCLGGNSPSFNPRWEINYWTSEDEDEGPPHGLPGDTVECLIKAQKSCWKHMSSPSNYYRCLAKQCGGNALMKLYWRKNCFSHIKDRECRRWVITCGEECIGEQGEHGDSPEGDIMKCMEQCLRRNKMSRCIQDFLLSVYDCIVKHAPKVK